MTDPEIIELISQRRFQVLIHSYLYYHYDSPIISDSLFDTWAEELWLITTRNPHLADQAKYRKEFQDWHGTGSFKLAISRRIKVAASRALRDWRDLQEVLNE